MHESNVQDTNKQLQDIAVNTENSATSANQSTQILSLQSIDTKMTPPLTVNATVVNTPTVVANAGTNLNTAALALESGGHLANVDAKLVVGQTTMSNSVSMTLASDQSSIPVANTPSRVATATITVSANITTASVTIIAANASRKGLILYNNSANTVYISFSATANSSTTVTYPIATFTSLTLPAPVYTGIITGIRNSGSGTVVVTELT